MKIETINFRDFINNDYGQRVRKRFDLKLYSSLLPVAVLTPSTWFTPPPMIAAGYMIIIGIGTIFIIAAILETFLARSGHTETAGAIIDFFKFVMPLAFIAALVYFVLTNPLLF